MRASPRRCLVTAFGLLVTISLLFVFTKSLPTSSSSSAHIDRLRRMSATERSYLSTGHDTLTARSLAITDENKRSNSAPPAPAPPDPEQQRLVQARIRNEDPMREGLLFPRPGSERWSTAREELERLFMFKTIVLFSKSYCPWSTKAKNLLLDTYRIDPAPYVVELDLIERGNEIFEELKKMTGRQTVPNLMVGKHSLGGFDEMNRLHEADRLNAAIFDHGGDRIRNVYDTSRAQ